MEDIWASNPRQTERYCCECGFACSENVQANGKWYCEACLQSDAEQAEPELDLVDLFR